MDIGETIAQCAEREVKEETGLTVTAYHLVGVYSDPDHVFANSDGEVRQEFSVALPAGFWEVISLKATSH